MEEIERLYAVIMTSSAVMTILSILPINCAPLFPLAMGMMLSASLFRVAIKAHSNTPNAIQESERPAVKSEGIK